MTKNEMLKELDRLEKEKGIDLDGIGQNSNKSTIQNAINCLLCPDDLSKIGFAYSTPLPLNLEGIRGFFFLKYTS